MARRKKLLRLRHLLPLLPPLPRPLNPQLLLLLRLLLRPPLLTPPLLPPLLPLLLPLLLPPLLPLLLPPQHPKRSNCFKRQKPAFAGFFFVCKKRDRMRHTSYTTPFLRMKQP